MDMVEDMKDFVTTELWTQTEEILAQWSLAGQKRFQKKSCWRKVFMLGWFSTSLESLLTTGNPQITASLRHCSQLILWLLGCFLCRCRSWWGWRSWQLCWGSHLYVSYTCELFILCKVHNEKGSLLPLLFIGRFPSYQPYLIRELGRSMEIT